jgi:hypothetical protein
LFLFSRCGISYYSGADKLRASMGGIRFARGRAETSALGVVDVLGRVPTSLCHSSISLVIAIHPSTLIGDFLLIHVKKRQRIYSCCQYISENGILIYKSSYQFVSKD